MNRFFLFFIVSSSLLLSCQDENSLQDPPNILFVLTDDQRWDALGYAGNELAHTPEMDRLAEQGLYFSHAMVSTPICAASRATILTGLYERTHRYDFQNTSIRGEFMQRAYPQELRKAGYYTGFFGKFGVKYEKADSLFDVFESYDRNGRFKDYRGYYYKTLDGDTVHLTRYTGEKALDFIDQAPDDQPFCLSLSFSAPHAHDGAPEQYFWQNEFDSILADVDIPDPQLGDPSWFDRLPKAVREGFNRLRWYWRYDTPEKYQHSVKGYYRMIAGVDREIGMIRDKLREKGLDQNTVIILMGDNGYFMGERQLAGKWLMYDHSVRVPLIIYDPRNPDHKVIDQLALNVDIPSTIVDFAGGDIPREWQGTSLVPFLTSESYDMGRDTALIEHLWEFEHIPPSEGLRTNEWKYLRYRNDLSIEELYHLENDPQETNNLAGSSDHEHHLKQFRKRMDQMARTYSDPYVGIPTELRVEMQDFSDDSDDDGTRRPTMIGDKRILPSFLWEIPQGAGKPLAFQILVASSREDIDLNKGSVWNTGQQECEDQTIVHYQGTELEPNHQYYWKVRVWDDHHRLTDYSDVDSFRLVP